MGKTKQIAGRAGRVACSVLFAAGMCWPCGLALADDAGAPRLEAGTWAGAKSPGEVNDAPEPRADAQDASLDEALRLEAVAAAARDAGIAGADALEKLVRGEDVPPEQILEIDVVALAEIDEDVARDVADLQREAAEELAAQVEAEGATTRADDAGSADNGGEQGTAVEGEPTASSGDLAPAKLPDELSLRAGAVDGDGGEAAEPEAGDAVMEAKTDGDGDEAAREQHPQWSYGGDATYTPRRLGVSLTTEKFIAVIGEQARTAAADNDLYASVMIAQAILESASGNSALAQAPNFNLFGVKGSYRGQSVEMATQEDDGTGAYYTIMASFRKYPSYRASLADYVNLMSGSYYAPARRSAAATPAAACDYLEGRYATSTSYSESLQDLIETYDLTRFDAPPDYELAHEIWVEVGNAEIAEALGIDEADLPGRLSAEWLRGEVSSDAAGAEAMGRAGLSEAESLSAGLSVLSARVGCGDMRVELSDGGELLKVEQRRGLADLALESTSRLGLPYQWGSTGPLSFDCSGLVWRCYADALDMELPRTTYYMCLRGEDVDFEDLHTGDLVFFADAEGVCNHVGMYLGEGCYIESTSPGGVQVTAMEERTPTFAKRILPVHGVAADTRLASVSEDVLSSLAYKATPSLHAAYGRKGGDEA